MNANNGWPGKPGVPLNPGLPGAHWLKGYTEDAWMYDGDGGWWGPGYSHKLDAETVAAHYSYLGPVLTPDEAAALQARADRNAAGFARVDAEAERAKFLHKQEIAALQKRLADLEGALKINFHKHVQGASAADVVITRILPYSVSDVELKKLAGGKDE